MYAGSGIVIAVTGVRAWDMVSSSGWTDSDWSSLARSPARSSIFPDRE